MLVGPSEPALSTAQAVTVCQTLVQIARTLNRWFNMLILILPAFSQSQVLPLGLSELVGEVLHGGRTGSRGGRERDKDQSDWEVEHKTSVLLGDFESHFVLAHFIAGLWFVFLPLIQLLNVQHVPSTVTGTGIQPWTKSQLLWSLNFDRLIFFASKFYSPGNLSWP